MTERDALKEVILSMKWHVKVLEENNQEAALLRSYLKMLQAIYRGEH